MKVKPSKPVSAGALVGLVFMILFGIGFAFLVGNVLSENEAPLAMKFVFFVFMAGWFGIAIFLLIYHAVNLKRAKGLPLIDIDTEPGAQAEGPMQRLRELDALKKDGLITESEYNKKRNEIMNEKW